MHKINVFGTQMPSLGIGTWGVGGYMSKNDYTDGENEIDQIKYQLSKGLKLLDCWAAQAEGESLKLIGQAIKDLNRNKYVLLSKFDVHKYEKESEMDDILKMYLDVLDVKYIDVFQIHKPDFSTISEKAVEKFLKKNIADGKIKHFAVANANINDIKNIQKKISVKLEANEILYNLYERGYDDDGTVKYCQDNNIKLIAYRPLNRGMVNTIHTSKAIANMLAKYNVTPPQLSLNWILSKKGFLALVKSVNRSHINENLDYEKVSLTNEDIELLDEWRG